MTTLPSRREVKEGLSKKDKKKLGKEKIRDKRRANAAGLRGGGGSEADADDDGDGDGIQGAAAKVTTLSAATAAQNLAVFLKNYSDWTRLSLLDESSLSSTTTTSGSGGDSDTRGGRGDGLGRLHRLAFRLVFVRLLRPHARLDGAAVVVFCFPVGVLRTKSLPPLFAFPETVVFGGKGGR